MIRDKVAIVTGASQGIGKGIASALARAGVKVVIADINGKLAEETAREMRAGGGLAVAAKVDVRNPAEVEATVNAIVSEFGGIDILVNCAGIINVSPTTELTEEQWDRVMDVNLKGVFLCSQAAAKVMIPQGGGNIISITSVGAHIGAPGYAAYCSSKAGVIGLTRVFAVEWGRHKIRANTISVSGIDTEMGKMLRGADPGLWERRIGRVPLGRQAQIEDVVNAVLFLADDTSSYMTGRDIVLDGGVLSVNASAVE